MMVYIKGYKKRHKVPYMYGIAVNPHRILVIEFLWSCSILKEYFYNEKYTIVDNCKTTFNYNIFKGDENGYKKTTLKVVFCFVSFQQYPVG